MSPAVVPSACPVRSTAWLALLAALVAGCSKPARSPDATAVTPSYDTSTGKLKELAYDANHNGVTDTWTDMDGARPVQTRIDRDEDGRIDRWEYYDEHGTLIKVGVSRRNDGKPNAWVFAGRDGAVDRIEISSVADEKAIDRWEHYRDGSIAAAEEDTSHDGAPDKWEIYEAGVVRTVTLDENSDGKADRRLNYSGGTLGSIESEPDAAGTFTRRLEVVDPSSPVPRPPD